MIGVIRNAYRVSVGGNLLENGHLKAEEMKG
jgi:hypothetical protein